MDGSTFFLACVRIAVQVAGEGRKQSAWRYDSERVGPEATDAAPWSRVCSSRGKRSAPGLEIDTVASSDAPGSIIADLSIKSDALASYRHVTSNIWALKGWGEGQDRGWAGYEHEHA